MADGSALFALLVIDGGWCLGDDARIKRARSRCRIAISDRNSSFKTPASDAVVKFRDVTGKLRLDPDARLLLDDNGKAFLQSSELTKDLLSRSLQDHLLFILVDQIGDVLRANVYITAKFWL